ncbi:MAG: DUF4176 domain-containing protein [Lachnospiraceae bacterium]|nr:DUF4176 domain-containing protein [Lachnospiraceae bacterium]
MKIKELLPIGSIVKIGGVEKKFMIIGVRQTDMETNKEYDYMASMYPEGFVSNDGQILLEHEMIEQVVFIGYEDSEREKFLNNLCEYYKMQDN